MSVLLKVTGGSRLRIRETDIVVVLPTQVDGINIHTSVVGPIVCESDDQLDSCILCSGNHFIEWLQVDGLRPVVPALEDDLSVPSPFASVIRQPAWNCRDVLVIETPSAEHFQAGISGG